jgi:hypothetical protein
MYRYVYMYYHMLSVNLEHFNREYLGIVNINLGIGGNPIDLKSISCPVTVLHN